MFVNPYISRELARERQRDMLAHARHQRLVRQLRAGSRTTRHREQPWQRLRRALRAATGLRATPNVTSSASAGQPVARGVPGPRIAG